MTVQVNQISDIVETLNDPDFYKKKLTELQKREKAAIDAEVQASNKIKELERKQVSLELEEKMLRKEVGSLKDLLDTQVGYHKKLEAQLRAEYEEKMNSLNTRDKALIERENEADARISKASQRENLADNKMSEVKRRESLLAEKQAIIDHNMKLFAQVKS